MRSGDQVRAVAQLVEAPNGRLIASNTVHGGSRRPVSPAGQHRPPRGRGAVAAAHRVNGVLARLAAEPGGLRALPARQRAGPDLRRAGTGARSCIRNRWSAIPASRRHGRAWGGATASSASSSTARPAARAARRRPSIARSALSPALTIAHKFYANLEADIGLATRAMVRLLEQASRHGNDPELFAGLVHALRYCGLFDQSIVAHEEARRLDPHVPTSVEQTVMMTGDIERLLAMAPSSTVGSADQGIRVIGLGLRRTPRRGEAAAGRDGAGLEPAGAPDLEGVTSQPGSTIGSTTCGPGRRRSAA